MTRLPVRRLRLHEIGFGLAIALALGGFIGVVTSGCDANLAAPLLVPTGGQGPGGSCTSEFANIRMVGDFTSPGFSIPISPQMAEDPAGCIWTVTVRLNAGQVLFKFITNDDFDATLDYGGSEAVTLDVPGGPHPTQLVSGTGTAIKVAVATTGDYTFTLNEKTLTWTAEAGPPPGSGGIAGTVAFANLSTAPYPSARVELFQGITSVAVTASDPTTRAFSFTGLDPGVYRVVASASCFANVERSDVQVLGAVNNIGEMTLAEGASTSSTIDLVGGFNVFTPGVDPMTQSPACLWTRERFLTAGVYPMMFIIDGQFATYYGGDPTPVAIPGGGPVTRFDSGSNALQISVSTDGIYRFELDERLQRWSATLVTPARERREER